MGYIGKCRCCDKTISYDDIPVCKECLDKFYLTVREYIYANGSSTPDQIKNATGVPLKVIEYFMQNGSLEEKEKTPEEKALEERRKKLAMMQEFGKAFETEKVNNVVEEKKGDGYFTRRR